MGESKSKFHHDISEYRRGLKNSAAVIAVLISTQAFAQAAADQPSNADIVVTAQKRAESLQNVPISIGVLRGEALDQSSIRDSAEALGRVTSVSVLPGTFGGSQITIRGVAPGQAVFSGPAPVAYYLDAAPIGFVKSAFLPDANVYDLARIEVLRGPQGTLYGANALNGVVRILTQDPNLEKFEAKVRGTLSTIEAGGQGYRGDIAVNVPLVEDRLAIRIVGGAEKRAGWIDHPGDKDANDGDAKNIRLKIAARPSDLLSVDASAWISRSHFDSLPTGRKDLTSPLGLEPYSSDFDIYNLKVRYDIGFADVSSSSSYAKYSLRNSFFQAPGIFLDTSVRSSVYSEELTLNSKDTGPWQWAAGGFYRSATDHNLQSLVLLPAPLQWTEKSRSFAFFGELTRKLFDDRIKITGGLRYFRDRSSQVENTPVSGNPAQILNRTAKTFTAVTPRAVLTWLPNSDTSVYASYSQGFRSGFSQTPIALLSAPTLPAVNPDRLTNYELGAKGALLDRKLRYEAAVFYIDWKRIQLPLTIPVPGTTINAAAVANGAKANGLGAELSLDVQVTSRFSVGGAFGYNGLTFDSDVISAGLVLFPAGSPNPNASKYTANGHAEYTFPIGDLQATLSASANYISKQSSASLGATGVISVQSDDVLIARASARIDATSGWSITAFVDNLTNTKKLYSRATYSVDRSVPPQPRTFGLQLEVKM